MTYDFYAFSSMMVIPLVIAWIVFILLALMTIASWFMDIINAFRGRYYKMPFVGDFVENYISK